MEETSDLKAKKRKSQGDTVAHVQRESDFLIKPEKNCTSVRYQ